MTQEFVTLPREVAEQALEALFEADSAREDYQNVKVRRDYIAALRAALEQPQIQSGGIPPNWKLVPVEPTIRMRLSARVWTDAPTSVYQAMLAAAPQPPAGEKPQANQPDMTQIAQRKLDSLLAEGYTISGYSVYHEQKHQHGFVTGAGLVGWWKPDGVEYPQPQVEQEPVGEAGSMPGTDGFTMACFRASDVPVGTKLYTHQQPKREPLTDMQKMMCWSRATHDADVWHKTEHQCLMDYGAEIEAAHNIK